MEPESRTERRFREWKPPDVVDVCLAGSGASLVGLFSLLAGIDLVPHFEALLGAYSVVFGVSLGVYVLFAIVIAACRVGVLQLSRATAPVHLVGSVVLAGTVALLIGPFLNDARLAEFLPGAIQAAALAALAVLVGGAVIRREIRSLIVEQARRIAPHLLIIAVVSLAVAIRTPAYDVPFMTTGNHDLWMYLKVASIALDGAVDNNVVGLDLSSSISAGSQTPVAVIFLAFLSCFSGLPAAAIVSSYAALGVSALAIGVYELARTITPSKTSTALVLSLFCALSGTLYVVVNLGFLAQLLAAAIGTWVIYIALWPSKSARQIIAQSVAATGLFYVLLLTYSIGFAVTSGIYGVLVLVVGAVRRPPRWVFAQLALLLAPIASALLLGVQRPAFLVTKIHEVLFLGSAVAGWPLDLVNPLNLFAVGQLDSGSPALKWSALAAMVVVSLFMAWRSVKSQPSAERSSLVALYIGAATAATLYAAYFLREGPSYQQWKFALIVAAPILVAWPLALITLGAAARGRTGTVLEAGLVSVLILGCIANVVTTQTQVESRRAAFATYAGLRSLADHRYAPSEPISVDFGGNFEATMVAAQFIHGGKITFYSPSYFGINAVAGVPPGSSGELLITSFCGMYAHEALTFLADGFCMGRNLKPAILPHIDFRAGSTTSVRSEGLSAPEPWGAWTTANEAIIYLVVDPKWKAANISIDATPFKSECSPKQTVVASAGDQQVGRWTLEAQQRINFSVQNSAFSADGTLALHLSFPDAVSLFSCTGKGDTRALGVGLAAVDVSGS